MGMEDTGWLLLTAKLCAWGNKVEFQTLLQLSPWVDDADNHQPGLVTYADECIDISFLKCAPIVLVCTKFLHSYHYASMGIVDNYPAIVS